tara:strand:- start:1086 stop:2009 length:924 start_codon:yes stop_codon:yes gene_type:complete
MKDKKIIFMGTPNIAAQHLQALIDNNLNIVGVYTQPPRKKNRGMKLRESEVGIIAKKNNLKIFYPTIFKEKELNDIKILNPDLIIVVAFGIILPEFLLNIPKFGCLNVHVSLLPRWRGATPIEHALLFGDTQTGVSIIKLSSKLDAGDILIQEKIKIEETVYRDELTQKLSDLGKKLIIKVLPEIFNKNIFPIKQDEKKITYAPKINSDERKIDFNRECSNVLNHIRAHGPSPGSWFIYNGERIKILKAIKKNTEGQKSTILNKQFLLGCKEGSILPILIQREGKKITTLDNFLRGFNFKVNDQLNV